MTVGIYQDVNTDSRAVLAFFSSERSGPARRMESPLAHLERKERDRLRLCYVDVDDRPELAEHFDVTLVPTLVLIRSGHVVARHEGRASMTQIERLLEGHLSPETFEPAAA
jgi:thioredoxin-like negative regulator of GroEL